MWSSSGAGAAHIKETIIPVKDAEVKEENEDDDLFHYLKYRRNPVDNNEVRIDDIEIDTSTRQD